MTNFGRDLEVLLQAHGGARQLLAVGVDVLAQLPRRVHEDQLAVVLGRSNNTGCIYEVN